MMNRTRIISLALSALPVLVLCTACDHSTEKKDAATDIRWTDPAKPAVGPKFDDQDFVLTVEAPTLCKSEGPMAPSPKEKRLSIPVKVQGKSSRQVPVNPLLFTLEDAEGHEARPTLAGCRAAIPQMRLVRDEHATGDVTFDVPLDFRAAELRFEPFLIGREKVIARVDLSSAP